MLFVPSWRRDTRYVSPGAFTGLRDVALAESPEDSRTLEGVEAEPALTRAALLRERRVLLVTDASPGPEAAANARDRAELDVLRGHFTKVADERVHGRRLEVFERRPGS